MNIHLSALGALVSFAVAGCVTPGGGEPVLQAQQAAVASNGTALNGIWLDGVYKGISLNGRSLNGVSLEGVSVSDVRLGSTWLDGTVFHGTSEDGHPMQGPEFVHAVFTGVLDDQSTVALRIDAMSSTPGDGDVHRYAVSVATDGGWSPLCTDESGAPTTAIPLAGRWSYEQGVPGGGAFIADPAAFTFACTGHALAKCVDLGYAPWRSVEAQTDEHGHASKVSLAPYHQACTRLIRADYCGDGTPHTVDGTMIDLYDAIGVEPNTQSWPFEAEWGPDGARCVARERVLQLPAPSCWAGLQKPDCGDVAHFSSGTLIMDEDRPTPSP